MATHGDPGPERNSLRGFAPYEDRPIRFAGLREPAGWAIKVYEVWMRAARFEPDRFAQGEAMALRALPDAPAPGRPGVGFLILHQGRGMDYAVLAWWDRENELPTRVFVDEGAGWRSAVTESFCVWDMQIMNAERDAYVRHVLADPRHGDLAAYLADTCPAS